MAGYNVSLAKMADAKTAYDAAATHFGALAGELEQQVKSLRENKAFEGGHGMTGHFQGQLSRFSTEWLKMMDKFVADEKAFVAFLQGFANRLAGTHGLYQELEARNSAIFDDIMKSLDRGK